MKSESPIKNGAFIEKVKQRPTGPKNLIYLVGNQKLSQTQTCNEKLGLSLSKIDLDLIPKQIKLSPGPKI